MSPSPPATGRALVVGGGVLGTMHAVEACRRGWDVLHLEADAGPRRASVRNFGLVWVGGRSADDLPAALRARQRWEEIAAAVPRLSFRANGSITVARTREELDVLREAAERPDAADREFELLDDENVTKLNPAVRGERVGGLLCRQDAIVEPTSVLDDLRQALLAGRLGGRGPGSKGSQGRYEWLPGRQVVDVGPAGGSAGTDSTGGVEAVDHLGVRHGADVVIHCPGDRLTGLGGPVGAALAQAPIRRCRLQMLETAPAQIPLTTALADGDSLRYYPAFDLPARRHLPPPTAETARWAIQLLLVQRVDGSLTIGDTHVYDEPFAFAVEEHVYDDLRARAEAILGWALPHTTRRWAGVYTGLTGPGLCFRTRVAPAVWVVTAPAGRGMTLSPAIAEATWEEIAP